MEVASPLFVLSFCRHEKTEPTFQHGLLSQWRAYAGSAGFAIEFDDIELDELVGFEKNAFAYAVMKSNDVRYKDYEELFEPEVYRGVAGEFIRRLFETQNKDVSEITGQKDLDPVILKFASTAPFLKHEGFEEERESTA
jgi:Protein of unknown function (DUF2971)